MNWTNNYHIFCQAFGNHGNNPSVNIKINTCRFSHSGLFYANTTDRTHVLILINLCVDQNNLSYVKIFEVGKNT